MFFKKNNISLFFIGGSFKKYVDFWSSFFLDVTLNQDLVHTAGQQILLALTERKSIYDFFLDVILNQDLVHTTGQQILLVLTEKNLYMTWYIRVIM